MISNRIRASIFLLLAGAASPAFAQEDSGEIVVTAQRRAERLQDIGVSVTALSGDQLKQLGVMSSTDLGAQTSGLQVVPANGGSTIYFSLRGVSQSDFGDQQESPVATYVDDVYLGQPAGAGFLLFDMERVEVLRGPQGTLFGRNATGGLVHFISKKPTFEPDGYLTAGVGSYGEYRGEGAFGAGIGEQVAFRLSLAGKHHDGYIENRLGKDLGNDNELGGRLQLLIKPSPDLDVLLNVRGTRLEARGGGYEHVTSTLGADGLGRFIGLDENPFGTCNGCDPVGYVDTDDDLYAGDYDYLGYTRVDTRAATGKLEWSLGDVTLHSITDYSHLTKRYSEDSDSGPVDYITSTTRSKVRQFSQEFRLDGTAGQFRWNGGLYYLSLVGDYGSLARLAPFDSQFLSDFKQKTRSFAAYGQVEYSFNDQLTAIGGFRWTEERKSLDYVTTLFNNAGDDLGELLAFNPDLYPEARNNKGDWSARAQLNYKPSSDLLLYASWNRGLKSGGFNAPQVYSGIDDISQLRFDSEVLNAYEGGSKWTLPNRLGHLNGALFYYDYQNYQAFDFQGLTQFLFNADASIKGGEAELFLTPVDGLTASGGVTFLQARAKNIPLPNGSFRTRKLPFAPQWSFSAMLRYEWKLGGATASAQVDAKYMSGHYFSIANASTTYQGKYVVPNARIGLDFADGSYSIAAFVKNFTGTKYSTINYDLSSLGLTERFMGRPRWFGVEVNYKIK
ncbi:TonB-dependent receptor [Sphingobium boeckii]|uniref:Iron complex outermembrane receptor protein n=1 Tax=Sphingobium boeckii TaxID=1082345 RepID=A0A7W9EDW3_9SPHN|nr:TonB-dependent receptor [Sphingobium boeckii]MBB5685698.1 iron complex outermembrane receptor protein [Sphingobium boeckii]